MAKFMPDATLDARLDLVSTAVVQHLCQGQPTTFADIASLTRAVVAMTGGDFTKANGPVDGRQVTVGAKSDVAVTANGTGDHVALATASVLLSVTTCDAVAVTTADTVNFPAWNDRERDPV